LKEGTQKFYTNQKETVMHPAPAEIPAAAPDLPPQQNGAGLPEAPKLCEVDPAVNALVMDLIGRIADKWTMAVLEVLAEEGTLRFTRLAEKVPGISQKMLTQTLRAMERDGLLLRKVHPVVPPHVDYSLTDLGLTLGAAFCGVWTWAETNLPRITAARTAFDAR
jgi:DNA-binding HxlR family transcriptional regulator